MTRHIIKNHNILGRIRLIFLNLFNQLLYFFRKADQQDVAVFYNMNQKLKSDTEKIPGALLWTLVCIIHRL